MVGAGKKRLAQGRHNHAQEGSKNSNSETNTSADALATTPADSVAHETVSGSSMASLDGNRDPTGLPAQNLQPAAGPLPAFNRNIDLGAKASQFSNRGTAIVNLPERNKLGNKTGRAVNIRLNTFNVSQYPSKPVHQYDVIIGSGSEKRGLVKKLWASRKVQDNLGSSWIFDGNKLAWALDKHTTELRLLVDLDQEDGKTPKIDKATGEPRSNKHKVIIRLAKTIAFTTLRSYLECKCDFDNNVLEAINFLDHLMRESPSKSLTAIKRNLFARGEKRFVLGFGAEAFKGVYASIRMVNAGLGLPATLSVNVDVANGTFWTEGPLVNSAMALMQTSNVSIMINNLRDGRDGPAFRALAKMKRLHVYINHKNQKASKGKEFVIDYFKLTSARTETFKTMDTKTNKEKEVTYMAYFAEKYDVRLQHPDLPLVVMTAGKGKIVYPMELCYIPVNQRYNSKLNDRQTSEMIKFAVTPPPERWAAVDSGLKLLNWPQDRYMAEYGLKIDSQATVVRGRVLQNPKVTFGAGGAVDPRTSGRWDLKGKKFLDPHPSPLKSWGVCIIKGRGAASEEQVRNFIKTFVGVFQAHGGKVATPTPHIMLPSSMDRAVEEVYKQTGDKFQLKPQLLVFIVPDKDSQVYARLKKSSDCRYGVVSQVLQSMHVQKAQAQYCSNVCMKVNAKLGGSTSRAVGMKGSTGWFTKPTMVIGADVSHSAPGVVGASIAAVTVSWDRHAIKYAAIVETNGARVEMIRSETMQTRVQPLIKKWVSTIAGGKTPQHVLYFRDGVSEGQYAQVLQTEVHDLRKIIKDINPQADVKFTVIVASKRHHVRFFPPVGASNNDFDRNGNALPGTLVESGVTHPFEYDFYLCAHNALQGTARPVHYHVLLDEAKMSVEELQNMVYEASYQYVRSTTPVSLFPAVYYAHLASNRGTHHIDQASISSEEKTTKKTGSSAPEPSDFKPLLEMPNSNGIQETMWYV